jgi:hypothetical protein
MEAGEASPGVKDAHQLSAQRSARPWGLAQGHFRVGVGQSGDQVADLDIQIAEPQHVGSGGHPRDISHPQLIPAGHRPVVGDSSLAQHHINLSGVGPGVRGEVGTEGVVVGFAAGLVDRQATVGVGAG